jgi:transcriptional regulator with XRE-family HTH domain
LRREILKMIVDSSSKNIIGERVKEARLNSGLSQKQLSEKLEIMAIYVCRGSISRIESGRRLITDFELEGIAKVLNVSIEYMFSKDKAE